MNLLDSYNFTSENWGKDPYEYIPGKLDRIDDPNHLFDAFMKSKKQVAWKESVQRYKINMLSNFANARISIEDGTYFPMPPYEFILNERGHKRYIKAVNIIDRVIQRSLNDNVFIPEITNLLINDNGASQTGKGISFARNEFKKHLYNSFLEYGMNGYILIIDFSKYFDNIVHSIILDYFKNLVSPEEFEFIQKLFLQFRIDVSYLSDDEYETCLDDLFNSLDYEFIDRGLLTKEKFMNKSVGIGNQMSQITGIYYPHRIDNYCKIIKGIKYYGRYMDDIYIIGESKEYLEQLLNEIKFIAENELKIHINMKKTKIQPMYSQITYLKINYKLTNSGRIIERISSDTIARELNKISMFRNLYDNGKMSLPDIVQAFLSWYGNYIKFDSKEDVNYVQKVFKSTFGIDYNTDLHDYLNYLFDIQKENKINMNSDYKYYM